MFYRLGCFDILVPATNYNFGSKAAQICMIPQPAEITVPTEYSYVTIPDLTADDSRLL